MSRAETPRRLTLGTAGHIDHGKTALVKRLTGVDTDRLPEEKSRGITIDLGFAPLDLPDGRRLSVVDVPGHERLVRTMVSGATGIDLVLLVVAADEGVMPQTREHVAICDLLGVVTGVVALTKTDLVDDEMQELAGEEVAEELVGTGLAGSEVVPVSSHTGAGVEDVAAALARAADRAERDRARGGPPRLAIDRVLSLKGFGAVVTGTLVGSALAVGDEVEVLPGGSPARVRSLESHGRSADRVEPGVRCAANLQGADANHLARGQVVCPRGALEPTRTLDVSLDWLAGAPADEGPVSVELLTGTAHHRARVAPIGQPRLEPGERGFARVHVEDDAVLLPGDRFIVRGFARLAGSGATLGGGLVLDVRPPRRSRRDPELFRELEVLHRGSPGERLFERVRRAGFSGVSSQALGRETGAAVADLALALEPLRAEGRVARAGASTWIDGDALTRLEERLGQRLDEFHRDEPLRPGMPRAALRGALPDNVPREATELALARLEERGELVTETDGVRRPGHAPRLDAEAEQVVKRLVDEARALALEPPAPREWAERLGVDLERFRDLVAHLEREGHLVRAPGDLWFDAGAIESLRARVVAHFDSNAELATPDYKALIGTTRRTAVPLMELFDERKVTARRGEARILRDGGVRFRTGEDA